MLKEWLQSEGYWSKLFGKSKEDEMEFVFDGPKAGRHHDDFGNRLVPLFRGIAGDYQGAHGQLANARALQYFTNSFEYAWRYAARVAKKTGLPPRVIRIDMPSSSLSRYYSKSDVYGNEVYDIPAEEVANFRPRYVKSSGAAVSPSSRG